MTLRTTCLSAFAAAMLMATVPTGAQANIEVGGLSCRSPGTVGYVVGAILNFNCVFVPSNGGPAHRYVGVVRRIGLDLGWTSGVSMGWVVFAPTGITCARYITTRRLDRARSLLSQSASRPVADIAFACGFESLTTFYRAFRVAFRRSPSEFRKSIYQGR